MGSITVMTYEGNLTARMEWETFLGAGFSQFWRKIVCLCRIKQNFQVVGPVYSSELPALIECVYPIFCFHFPSIYKYFKIRILIAKDYNNYMENSSLSWCSGRGDMAIVCRSKSVLGTNLRDCCWGNHCNTGQEPRTAPVMYYRSQRVGVIVV